MTTQPPAQELPELPKNMQHVMRRIRACEGEEAARIVLEHAMREYGRACIAASQAGRVEPIAWASADLEDIMSANLKAAHERANSFTPRDYPVALYATPPLQVREAMSECGLCDNRHTADAIAKCPHGKFCGAKAAS